jgi:hypothetical protein
MVEFVFILFIVFFICVKSAVVDAPRTAEGRPHSPFAISGLCVVVPPVWCWEIVVRPINVAGILRSAYQCVPISIKVATRTGIV